MSDANAFVNSASKKEVVEAIEKKERLESRIQRVERTKKELAMATAAMGFEVAGALGGGAIVGYMQAHDYEEWIGLGAVAVGAIAGVKRLDDPTSPYPQIAFASALGMGAALVAGYSRDYFSPGGKSQPMT